MGLECDPYPDSASKSQRKWIYQRDEGVCQMPTVYVPGINVVWSICGSEGEETHHIWPKRSLVFETGSNPHTEWNLILLCRYHHWMIHPDIAAALREKAMGNQNALEELFERRRQLLREGKPYWETTWDSMLKRTARQRTLDYVKANPKHKFPITHGVGQTTYAY